ncbi:blastopia polyprotein [Lasius niger]|uniref:RNA-directed DNA polymerase n=1 Tax=Lasius niger TaxID=67767 RepID=A0A0J7K8L8_LASNI|nr:blastopia polyprotein [Lasius niger]
MHFSEPRDVRQVQAFLGLSGYFRKFIPKYSLIARPLSDLLRANVKFHFDVAEKDAFKRLKTILSERPVLNLYRVNAETELHTDASMYGYGAILLQRNSEDRLLHPVYYASGKTTPAEEKYTSYELEVLAIIRALKRFRVYLLGIEFKIVTDCRAFALTMSKRDLCVRVARWALLLEEFRYSIEHRPGKNMVHVDALSRSPLPSCLVISECEEGLLARLRKAQREDSDLKKIADAIERGEPNNYVVRSGILYKDADGDIRVVVPRAMRRQVIRKAHEQGHFGVGKTEALLRKDYWIPGLRAEVEKVIKNCITCILAERKHGRSECFLSPIEKGSVPLDTFHIDYLGPLPSTKKSYVHIFVMVDGFSKFTWLYATKSASAMEAIGRLKRQSCIFANPRRIVSDRGSAFTSGEFEEYCRSEGISHQLITTGVPRANGQVERVNRTLIPLLTKLSAPKPHEWYKYLDIAQLYLNSTLHRSIGMTPFRVMLGVDPRIRDNPDIKELLQNELITLFSDDREELREQAQKSIEKIQRENKANYDKKRKEPSIYCEGDLVAIRRTQQGPGLKFAHKYLGPYEIIKALRNHRYVVHKVGEHEGPLQTSSVAEYMKPWIDDDDDVEGMSESEDEEKSERSGRPLGQDGRV